MVISSKSNPTIKRISSLAEKKYRKLYGQFIVESVKAVDECLSSGMQVEEIVCTQNLADKYPSAIVVTDELFERISTEKTPQGVLAVAKLPQNSAIAPRGSCLLLDRLQDPGNIGTIIRTANAAGYEDIYLVNCADPYSPKAVRASMGGVFYVNLHESGYDEVFEALKGIPLICADMSGEDIFAFGAPERFCLCIGNEGDGVSDTVVENSAYKVKIPMRETCESLNAGVSAAVAMYVLKNNNQ
ncbi:MAG: RNA methyltransferase [Clostridiales bacterium]|nr:RNA methyltransferase [Clostridiales bacterium]